MAELMRLARSPWPLPLGGLKARRSLLGLDNLAGAVATVLAAPDPIRRPFVVADPTPMTIAEMVRAMRAGLGRDAGVIPVPAALLELAARAAGRAEAFERIGGSLVADPSALIRLGWKPEVSSAEGLAALMRSEAPKNRGLSSGSA
jgi:UDP-glucose 4-epimerase